MDPLASFSEPTRRWFDAAFAAPTDVQAAAWPRIQAGADVLAVAPTGSGKTLAAFLCAIDRCLTPREESGVRVLYISPLKALAVDVERNLRAPLSGIATQCELLGLPAPHITVALRTGDTPAQERRVMARRPPDVLITTPESLFLMLTSATRSILAGVESVIIDEVHAIAGSKRGAHLAVSLARLDHLAGRRIPRVGLSATVRPTHVAARFLGGDVPVEILEAGTAKQWELTIQVPVEDLGELGTGPGVDGSPTASIWPHVEQRIVELIEDHRSTIVFANSRRLAERITARLNEIHAERTSTVPEGAPLSRPPAEVMAQAGQTLGAPQVLARAHHGSVSKEQRALIEDDLKTGRLRAVVATSSLELGIDMGAVDLVVQVESPPSVASGLQRVGRAGHQVGAVSTGVVLPKYRSDLLTSAVVVQRMRSGAIEELRIPANPLDVAAQQIVACVAMDDWSAPDLLALLRRSAPFAELPPAVYEAVVEMLAGRYPSDAFAELRPRIVWDRADDMLRARPGAQQLAVTSGGTIPDRGLFAVHIVGGGRVGELDEEMVYESRVGDIIALGASSWQIIEITHDRVNVTPAPGSPGRLPFWRGDNLGRPAELGRAIGEFTRTMSQRKPEAALGHLAELGLDAWAGANLVAYLAEQAATSHLPTDRTIVVERTRDELGDWRITVLSPFGAQVHAPWALLARERLARRFGVDAAVLHGDDGIVARLPDVADDEWLPEATACLFPEPDEIEADVTRLIGGSALFASRFRECASRALLLPRPRPGRRAPLWQQRQRSAQLLQIAAEHPTFPIVLEAVRECVKDVYDLPALVELMTSVAERRIRVVEVTPASASPFARSLLFGYVSEYLYEGDSPLAERRAAALTLDPSLLGELLGQTDLRDLLEPEAIAGVVAQIQHLTDERRARGLEDAADMLRVLGPLSTEQAALRGIAAEWLDELEAQRRILRTRVSGHDVWAGVEDAARLRDGLGAPIPSGVAEAHLSPVEDPLGDLIARYSRTHGPFTVEDVVGELGLPPAVVSHRLATSRAAGRVIEGWFIPDSPGPQWCHPDVLRLIKRRSVAMLRQQIEPVSQAALATFLPRWQNIGQHAVTRLRGVDGVLQAIRAMAGVAVPASALEDSILPLRVADYAPAMLDELTSAGEVLWTGSSPLPGGDGWVALAPAEVGFLLPRADDEPGSPVAREVLGLLRQGGGWFVPDLRQRMADPHVAADAIAQGILDLLWCGLISNDSIEPIRATLHRSPGRRRRVAPGARHRPRRPARGRYADLWHRPQLGADPSGAESWAAEAGAADAARGGPGRAGSSPARSGRSPELPGRWFALPSALPSREVVALARAEAHLDRLGIVTRGAVLASGDPGGFAAAYRTLSLMEERGRVQRVYAVEGLGASQFALTGVVDQVRAVERELADGQAEHLLLATTDPANPYGAALEWPTSNWAGGPGSPHRPSRGAGCHVVLVSGRPILYVERGGHTLLTFTGSAEEGDTHRDLAVAARLLHAAVKAGTVNGLTISRVNGTAVMEPGGPGHVKRALEDAGFGLTPRGYRVPR
ncbi:MAG TPA: DEAD/DEAH box helicase [Motilibacterales bacterium]|nr:DEAD/DEAH box helicase [Motilibacterales bacterium]